jgi:hypothetical protein
MDVSYLKAVIHNSRFSKVQFGWDEIGEFNLSDGRRWP